ncbi:hypothetical protein MMC11_003586 [Xylographa trunciseda]|nr:hypothetical protein [Xylographa trunciseda]
MKLLPCLRFFILGIFASTLAQRVENDSSNLEQQEPVLLEARDPSGRTESSSNQVNAVHAYFEYLARGRRLWADLSDALATNSPDLPSDSARISQTWDFTYRYQKRPPTLLRGPLRTLHLPTGEAYTRVTVATPKDLQGWEQSTDHIATQFMALYNVENGVIIITAECMRQLSPSRASAIPNPYAPTQNAFINLRYVFMHLIASISKTEPVINEILMVHRQDRNGRPARFLPDMDTFRVLLGSPNGQGVAYLLSQQKNAFQRKTIRSVTLQAITPEYPQKAWCHLWWEFGRPEIRDSSSGNETLCPGLGPRRGLPGLCYPMDPRAFADFHSQLDSRTIKKLEVLDKSERLQELKACEKLERLGKLGQSA